MCAFRAEGRSMGRVKRKGKIQLVAGGALTGAVNGLLGGGGGMLAVPLLQRAAGYPARRAHATAIAVILPASALSGAVYLYGGLVPLSVLVPVALGVCLGGFLGAKLLARISARAVTVAFAALMLAAGLRMLF